MHRAYQDLSTAERWAYFDDDYTVCLSTADRAHLAVMYIEQFLELSGKITSIGAKEYDRRGGVDQLAASKTSDRMTYICR